MKQKVFSVYDCKAKAYLQPFHVIDNQFGFGFVGNGFFDKYSVKCLNNVISPLSIASNSIGIYPSIMQFSYRLSHISAIVNWLVLCDFLFGAVLSFTVVDLTFLSCCGTIEGVVILLYVMLVFVFSRSEERRVGKEC